MRGSQQLVCNSPASPLGSSIYALSHRSWRARRSRREPCNAKDVANAVERGCASIVNEIVEARSHHALTAEPRLDPVY
jgi:hypothetical protein